MKPSKPFAPLYLIHGEERFLIQELHRRYLAALLDPATEAFNYTPLKGDEASASDVLGAASTLPVLSDKRLVWVWEADQMDPGETDQLLGYLEHPSPTTVLVLTAAKPDFRKKFFSALRSRGEVISCGRIPEWELSRWISERAKSMGLTLPQDVVVYLKESVGNDLHRLVNELEKLQLISADGGGVSVDLAQQVIVGTRGHSVFDWLRGLGGKNLSLAVQYLQELLADGEHPLFLLTMAIRQLRQMSQAKDHLGAKGNPAELPRLLGFPPSVLPSFLQQLRLWSEDQLRQGLSLCLEIDVQLKGGALSGERLLEGMVFDLCQGGCRHSPKSLLI